MPKTLVPEHVEAFIRTQLVQPTIHERGLHEATMSLERAGMCSSHEVGAVLSILIKVCRAKKALEIGVFTGFTALTVARALPDDGLLVACDISEEWASLGKPFWEAAGVASKIELRLAPALDTLASLIDHDFDFAFIDADKSNYPAYFEECLRLVKPGGVILLDNMLWSGKVADDAHLDAETVTLRELGKFITADPRVDSAMLTVGDGLMLAFVK